MAEVTSKEFEQALNILDEIAHRFPADSPEERATRIAAEALVFVRRHEVKEKFVAHLHSLGQPLTPDQILHLAAMGIDPDADEQDRKR